jgi:site-specific DNA recombinase
VSKWRVGYLRVSSDEQKENKTIEAQRDALQKHFDVHSIKIDKFYTDDGVSGTIALASREPGGSALMRDAAAGLISEIYILNFKRLGRNLRDFLNLCHKLEKLGVHIVSITESVPEGPAGRMMMQMLGAFAELDRENILENTRRGLAHKAAAGGWTGGPVPFGYRVEGEKRDARLVKHEAYAKVVHRLFEMAAEGKSCQRLANYLNEEKVPTSRQNPGSIWRRNSVRIIITNPIYTGTRPWGCRQWVKVEDDADNTTKHLKMTPERVIESACPVIVTQDLWDQANAALKTNQLAAMAHGRRDYLLQGLIKCGICGSLYGGCGYAYRCNRRYGARRLRLNGAARERCPAPLVNRAEIEGTVWDLCEAYIANPGKAEAELKREMEAGTEPARRAADDLQKERDKLANTTRAQERARIQYQEGWATKEEHDRDMQRLAERRSAIEGRIAELRTRAAEPVARAEARNSVRSVLEQLRASLKGKYTPEQKRRVVEFLIPGVTVLRNGDYRIDISFHCDARSWLRSVMAAKFPAGEHHGPATTEAEARAGAKGLRIALEATRRPIGPPTASG